jgi:tetratricopeptide (TPR) repeat protein
MKPLSDVKPWLALAAACLLSTLAAAAPSGPPPAALVEQLQQVQADWARINYQTQGEARKAAEFEALARRAAAFERAFPGRAEPLIWEGIVLSTYAGVKGGLGALGLAKQARDKLEAALRIDPSALEGSAYTSLGTLYAKVPGFPLGFGDDGKARKLLEAALKINPDGIDPNYFYGEFLYEEGQRVEAIAALRRALAAPPRPGRELADRGRRGVIEALLARAQGAAR